MSRTFKEVAEILLLVLMAGIAIMLLCGMLALTVNFCNCASAGQSSVSECLGRLF